MLTIGGEAAVYRGSKTINGALTVGGTGVAIRSDSGTLTFGASNDISLVRDGGAGILAMVNGATAQALRVYGSYAGGGTDYTRLLVHNDGLGTAYVLTQQGGAGTSANLIVGASGASNNLYLQAGASQRWLVQGSTGNLLANADNTYSIGATAANRPSTIFAAGLITSNQAVAAAAGGSIMFQMGTALTAICCGTGAPSSFTAPKGSLYTNITATTTTTRLYVNTDGGTTWTNFTTAA